MLTSSQRRSAAQDLHSWYRRFGKRAVDVLVGTTFALLTLPVILILAVVSVASLRAWPFFIQARVGRHGRLFRFPKIRTLPKLAPEVADKYEIADVPISRVCAFLRTTHLDELPQLWLVPFGRMSLIGPRPDMPEMLERYPVAFAEHRESVRPGCTGLWQVSTGSGRMIYEAPEFDEYYLANCSLSLDFRILALTAITGFGTRFRVSIDGDHLATPSPGAGRGTDRVADASEGGAVRTPTPVSIREIDLTVLDDETIETRAWVNK